MLVTDLYALADRLAEGDIAPADAAATLRELARFQRSAAAAQWTNPPLAVMESTTYRWWLVDDTAGDRACRIVSNRHARHPSNMVEEIDLSWADPAEVDALGRGLIYVAARLQSDRDNADDYDD